MYLTFGHAVPNDTNQTRHTEGTILTWKVASGPAFRLAASGGSPAMGWVRLGGTGGEMGDNDQGGSSLGVGAASV